MYVTNEIDLIKKIELLNKKSTNKVSIKKILNLVDFIKKHHTNQLRYSGEEYYIHPIAVTSLVIDYKFNYDIICASMLHDVIEDTIVTKSMLTFLFNKNIANIVSSLSNIDEVGSYRLDKKEIILKLTHGTDVKDVLLIKLNDRIHNLITAKYLPIYKRKRLVDETLEIYIPLAKVLNIKKIETLLMELAISVEF